jgi:hypothetical protein
MYSAGKRQISGIQHVKLKHSLTHEVYKMRELSIHELEIVSGGYGPVSAAGGAVVGAVGYSGYAITSGQGTVGGLAGATAMGAAVGFFGGPASFPAIAGGAEVTFHAGMVGGLVERAVNSSNTSAEPSGLSYCGGGY